MAMDMKALDIILVELRRDVVATVLSDRSLFQRRPVIEFHLVISRQNLEAFDADVVLPIQHDAFDAIGYRFSSRLHSAT